MNDTLVSYWGTNQFQLNTVSKITPAFYSQYLNKTRLKERKTRYKSSIIIAIDIKSRYKTLLEWK